MTKPSYIILLLTIVLVSSCNRKPQPINYGHDACAFCKMTITDSRYGSELITKKGKIYKFDSIECLVGFAATKEVEEENRYQLLVTNFANSPEFTDAATALYLISENLPSPMGANLTGFSNREEAGQFQAAHRGGIFTWEELNKELTGQK